MRMTYLRMRPKAKREIHVLFASCKYSYNIFSVPYVSISKSSEWNGLDFHFRDAQLGILVILYVSHFSKIEFFIVNGL